MGSLDPLRLLKFEEVGVNLALYQARLAVQVFKGGGEIGINAIPLFLFFRTDEW
ncbi:Uncharacterised protein [Serratia marcescens]|nr:Uncharacterised protein [Serratia marcescens]CUY65665.1 Uncharacterised protein [Serratia marcescens]CUY68736.1 Uncharacterised protein [Serratia marcescens]CUZ00173.1 Uncharacterised protein [Serratia marcescens]CVA47363.1 Uncharacterised protein [Serratia marcescens]